MAIKKTTDGRTYMGAALHAIRKQEHLSLEEVGSRIGISRHNMSRIENGRWNPGAEHLVAIADAMGYDWVLKKRDEQ